MFTYLQALLAGAAAIRPVLGATLSHLAGVNFYRVTIAPADNKVGVKLEAAGTTRTYTTASGYLLRGTWLTSGLNSDYEARIVRNSGTVLDVGAENTWEALTSDKEYAYVTTDDFYVFKQGNFTLQIRRVSDSLVVAEHTFTMECDVEV